MRAEFGRSLLQDILPSPPLASLLSQGANMILVWDTLIQFGLRHCLTKEEAAERGPYSLSKPGNNPSS